MTARRPAIIRLSSWPRHRLSRYDSTGLVKMTADSAAIRTASGRTLMYPKNNKPALGPFGDSLDDMGPL
jgi:hypothetical protein